MIRIVLFVAVMFFFSLSSLAQSEQRGEKVLQADVLLPASVVEKIIYVHNNSAETLVFIAKKPIFVNKKGKMTKKLELGPDQVTKFPYTGFDGRRLTVEVRKGFLRKNPVFTQVFRDKSWAWIYNGVEMEKTSDLTKIPAVKHLLGL